jgi:pilus assembly protein CpaD
MDRRHTSDPSYVRLVLVARAGVLAFLPLLGCSSIADEAKNLNLPIENWQDVEPLPQPHVEVLQVRHDVGFASGEANLAPGERHQLQQFLDQLSSGDSKAAFVIAAPGAGALDRQRVDAVGAVLTALRREWRPGVLDDNTAAPPPADAIAVITDVTVVSLPPCPNWSDWPQDTFSNRPAANFGCATAVNFGMTVANPDDLRQGRSPGPADGEVMSRSIQRYREGKAKDLIRDSASSEIFPEPGGNNSGGGN